MTATTMMTYEQAVQWLYRCDDWDWIMGLYQNDFPFSVVSSIIAAIYDKPLDTVRRDIQNLFRGGKK